MRRSKGGGETTTTAAHYLKAAGAQNCPEGSMVDSATECMIAGSTLGHPYVKEVSDPTARPAGCFWDQNGKSYFNVELQASATWGGVGAICKQATRRLQHQTEEASDTSIGNQILLV